MDYVLCTKVIVTCFIIWMVMCLIVSVTDDKRKEVLPDWFYLVGALNVFVGVVLFIVTLLSMIWS